VAHLFREDVAAVVGKSAGEAEVVEAFEEGDDDSAGAVEVAAGLAGGEWLRQVGEAPGGIFLGTRQQDDVFSEPHQ
jgi:hypothetical protein